MSTAGQLISTCQPLSNNPAIVSTDHTNPRSTVSVCDDALDPASRARSTTHTQWGSVRPVVCTHEYRGFLLGRFQTWSRRLIRDLCRWNTMPSAH